MNSQMKNKIIFTILAVLIVTVSYAQCDTVAIKAPIRFDTETIVTKSGKSTEKFYAIYNGETYDSTKTSMKRYYEIKRFNGQPCVVMITNKKSKAKKIIVL